MSQGVEGVEGLRRKGVKALLIGAWVMLGHAAGAQVQGVAEVEQASLAVDSSILLEGATVIGRRDELAADLPYQVELIGAAAQQRVQSLTTADALASLSGVYVQKSQLGGGSPIVRGFEANRVLLMVDGVRMNNAIYRNGHLQNIITVDPNVLTRTEVIYGAGALAYGSDAIGGVVHFRTRSPEYRPEGGTAGYLNSNLSSAARAVNLAAGIDYGGKRWAGLTSVSTTRFGDLRAGANRPDNYSDFGLRTDYVIGDSVVSNPHPQRQVGSGYTQYNLLQKLRYRIADRLEVQANLQYSTTSDVPRYDALTERRGGVLRWARWDYGPQTRILASLRLDDRRATRLYDVASYLLSYQFVEEDRLQRRLGDPVEEVSLVDVGSYNLQVDYRKRLLPGTDLRYGLDLRHDVVRATAAPVDEPTRYPSQGSGLSGGGAYLDLIRQLGPQWQLRGGIRYSYQRLTATFGAQDPVEWPQTYLEGIVSGSQAVTFAVGAHYGKEKEGIRILFAQGFRAPNVDDFAKFREQNGRIQVPNVRLQPERSNTLEVAYTHVGNSFQLEATAYGTLLNDAIIRHNGTLPDGSTFFVSRGDTLFADTNVNAESAWVYGSDLTAAYRITSRWEVRTDLHWLRGRRRQQTPDAGSLTLPQDHIPPAYGRIGLHYATGPWAASLRLDAQVRKQLKDYAVNTIEGSELTGYVFDRVGSADNPELTPFSRGTPSWYTINSYLEYRASQRLTVQLKVENMLDRFYQPFASGIAAAGIDVGVGIRWNW